MSDWRKFNKRPFTKGLLRDLWCTGAVQHSGAESLLSQKGTAETSLEPREWRGCWRGPTTRVRTCGRRALPAWSLSLEGSLEKTCLNILPSIHPSDCLMILSGTEPTVPHRSVSGGTEQSGEDWSPDLQEQRETFIR